MQDRKTIYELLEEAHWVSYPKYSVGSFLKALDQDIGPLAALSDGEMVRRLSSYIHQPFHKHPEDGDEKTTSIVNNSFF